jgi:hypothetical protein
LRVLIVMTVPSTIYKPENVQKALTNGIFCRSDANWFGKC